MSYFNNFKDFEQKINNIITSHKENPLLNELKLDLNKFIEDSDIVLLNHKLFLDKYNLSKNNLYATYLSYKKKIRYILLDEIDEINNNKVESLKQVNENLIEDLRVIDFEINTLSNNFSVYKNNMNELKKLHLNELLIKINKIDSLTDNIDDYYYKTVESNNESSKYSSTAIHSNHSKISYNLDEIQNNTMRLIEEKITLINKDIEILLQDTLQSKGLSRKSIVDENSFFNTKILHAKKLLLEDTDNLHIESKSSIKKIEHRNNETTRIFEQNRREIMENYITALDDSDDTYNAEYHALLEQKQDVIQEYEILINSLEFDLELAQKSNTTDAKNQKIININKRITQVKYQHIKNLNDIKFRENMISKYRQFGRYQAEIDKNAAIAIEEAKRDLEMTVNAGEIKLLKDFLQNSLREQNAKHDLSIFNTSLSNEKVILKHEMDIKYHQITSDYKNFKLNFEINKLRDESIYNQRVHHLVHQSNEEKVTMELNHENLLSMLKSERYKTLRDANHKTRLLSKFQYLNDHQLIEEKIEEKIRHYEQKTTLNITLLEKTKKHLEYLASFMKQKINTEASYKIFDKNFAYSIKIKKAQTKMSSNRLRIDKILNVNSLEVFNSLLFWTKKVSLNLSNDIKDHISSEDVNIGKNLIAIFKKFDSDCLNTLITTISESINTPSGKSMHRISQALLQRQSRNYRAKRLELSNIIKDAQNELRTNNRQLGNIANLKSGIEEQIAQIRHAPTNDDSTSKDVSRKQLSNLRISEREMTAKLLSIESAIVFSKKKLTTATKSLAKMDGDSPTLSKVKFKNKYVILEKFIHLLVELNTMGDNFFNSCDEFYNNITEITTYVSKETIVIKHNDVRDKLLNYIGKVHKVLSHEYSRSFKFYVKNRTLQHKKIMRKTNKYINNINTFIQNEFRRQHKNVSKFDAKIKRINFDTIATQKSIEKEHNISKKFLDRSTLNTKINLFDNLLSLDTNITDSELKYKMHLQAITSNNALKSKLLLKDYNKSIKSHQFELKRREGIYMRDLKMAPLLLEQGENDLMKEKRGRLKKIINEIKITTRQRHEITRKYTQNVNTLNRRTLDTIRRIKTQAIKQTKKFQ